MVDDYVIYLNRSNRSDRSDRLVVSVSISIRSVVSVDEFDRLTGLPMYALGSISHDMSGVFTSERLTNLSLQGLLYRRGRAVIDLTL